MAEYFLGDDPTLYVMLGAGAAAGLGMAGLMISGKIKSNRHIKEAEKLYDDGRIFEAAQELNGVPPLQLSRKAEGKYHELWRNISSQIEPTVRAELREAIEDSKFTLQGGLDMMRLSHTHWCFHTPSSMGYTEKQIAKFNSIGAANV